jgi:hypothetical protein
MNYVSQKATDLLYSDKPLSFASSPNSLNLMMCSHSSLKAARSAFVQKQQLQSQRKVCFDAADYGYGEDTVEEPPVKRRRFQRRNSKTPAMLMAMSTASLDLDFLEKKDEEKKEEISKNEDEDSWESGLEIAEELVKHLQRRRKAL